MSENKREFQEQHYAVELNTESLKEVLELNDWLVASTEWMKQLVDTQICRSLKVLDVCCSGQPTFARCARALGADV